MGKAAIDEAMSKQLRKVKFSTLLYDRIGEHIHGEIWATNIKNVLQENNLLEKPIHIISTRMESVLNTIFVPFTFPKELESMSKF